MDPLFYILTIISILLFLLELLMGCFAQVDYLWGFYFWLDLIATISLISDIGWIWYPMMGAKELEDAIIENEGTSGSAQQVGSKTSRIF